jgi:hypothetical protein
MVDERLITLGGSEQLPPPVGAAPDAPGGDQLADPRALTILTTEHWSLLSARSLVYNEAFARTGMFLTFLSASLVALALVAQGMGFDRDFLLLAAVILAFDLFIGLATLGRVSSASNDDLRSIAGMNRIRNAYLEIAPGLAPYFIASRFDDVAGVLATYGETADQPPDRVASFVHGLTTTNGMVAVITTAIGGILGAVVGLLARLAPPTAIALGVGTFVVMFGALLTIALRSFTRFGDHLDPRFPTPAATTGSDEQRRR